ncbi:MAG: hypothetical protein Ct9H300mP11_16500 [Chloroflexota bacterium]|nr:MAG: hypothetical protein Ct9H300mP11_16500 [Chloroflexota bacterium]
MQDLPNSNGLFVPQSIVPMVIETSPRGERHSIYIRFS